VAEPFLGEIRMFGFSFAPQGWALCNGQLLPISQNTALFSLLGTAYGDDVFLGRVMQGFTMGAVKGITGRIRLAGRLATAALAPCTRWGHRLQTIQNARRGCTIDTMTRYRTPRAHCDWLSERTDHPLLTHEEDMMTQPRTARTHVGTWIVIAIVLVAALIGTLWVPFYNHTTPALGGFPYFYWYQLLWVPIVAILSAIAYLLSRRTERSNTAARAPADAQSPGKGPGEAS